MRKSQRSIWIERNTRTFSGSVNHSTFRITLFFLHSYRNVLVTLRGTNKDRKCFQLVGDVLVEQTVADVLPKVEENEKGVRFHEGFISSRLPFHM